MNGFPFLNFHRKTIQHTKFSIFSISSMRSASITTAQSSDHILGSALTSSQCGVVLQSVTNSKSYREGQSLHAHLISSGVIQNNTYISTKLAAFYANCGHMDQAKIMFDGIVLKNSFLWNSLIRGCACNGLPLRTIVYYREMLSFGQKPDKFTYPFVIKSCGDLFLIQIGQRVHCEIVIRGLDSDIYVANSLLAMYSKFGDMVNAGLVFDRMSVRDLTSWNTMVSGHVTNGNSDKALDTFHLMETSGLVPDSVTLLAILSVFADLRMAKQGKAVHGYVIRNDVAGCNSFLINALINMYSSCKFMVDARQLFDITRKDTVSWNSMISGYARNGNALESLTLFCQMVTEGQGTDLATFIAVLDACKQVPALDFGMAVHSHLVRKGFGSNTLTATAVISLYSKCGSLNCARCAFDELKDKNLVSWSAMLAGYGLHGKGREAISIFHEMAANNIVPDEGTFTTVLTACSHAGLVEEGRELFHLIEQKYNNKPGLVHFACFVDLLSRAGYLDEAYEIIKKMNFEPTSDIWTSLLSACRVHGNITLAEVCAQKIFELDNQRACSYICLSHIYAAEERWDDVEKVRSIQSSEGVAKPPGCSFM
ncbi:hypothetical protein Nepgr_009028 [Nepenthes gracilis]|uniref:Pentatricopeptide repeat-containing protein n=1 Tax=Nepenthes gracilis TaxID=150966 RepID=A0AAD3S9L9_NEPGR|nr:hypothetical protein Nepgr_009028 [Nepenthes gracilis]